jgi:hypothetical protein
LDCNRHAVLVLRWFLDATRVAQLAVDNQISSSTAYRYLHEDIDVLAAVAPGVHGACSPPGSPVTRTCGSAAPLIRTDRSKAVGPTAKVDLWWSGKHHHYGGNVQVLTGPDGWLLWVARCPAGAGARRDLRSRTSWCARRPYRVD